MESETALTTPTTAFVTDWTRLACRLSPAIQSIRRPARWTVITFRFMSDHNDLYLLQLQALNEAISQGCKGNRRHHHDLFGAMLQRIWALLVPTG